uniref:Uncharacterized protein n=1 Tax=Ascaris lumbricoides TaxID=6252 RepID=A0A0M3I0T9_ASCLU
MVFVVEEYRFVSHRILLGAKFVRPRGGIEFNRIATPSSCSSTRNVEHKQEGHPKGARSLSWYSAQRTPKEYLQLLRGRHQWQASHVPCAQTRLTLCMREFILSEGCISTSRGDWHLLKVIENDFVRLAFAMPLLEGATYLIFEKMVRKKPLTLPWLFERLMKVTSTGSGLEVVDIICFFQAVCA